MSIWIRYLLAGLLACFSLSTLAADIAPLQQRWAAHSEAPASRRRSNGLQRWGRRVARELRRTSGRHFPDVSIFYMTFS